jgi:3',5'-cyclic AMP phosphodiesterase CpdA
MLRSLNETLHSTRVFNESEPALRTALDEIEAKGITLVLILGDMTDDGQSPNWEAAAAILRDYETRAGMRFFLTPGNHDQWVNGDLPQMKEFSAEDGSVFAVSSLPDYGNDPTPAMQRLSYAQMFSHASGFGFAPHPDDLLWETPFGTNPALEARMGAITTDPRTDFETIPVPDLSYLVEPVAGLWILSIDASVYWPDPASNKGGWRDGSSEGWAAVLHRKSWLLDWMSDVSARAKRLGKRLVTFSHYPVLDVLNGASGQVDAVGKRRVMPDEGTAARIAATGIGLHFSGHWHLNRSATRRATPEIPALVNVAAPSTVGYPAGWKEACLQGNTAEITTHLLTNVTGRDLSNEAYRIAGAELPEAEDYQSFLRWHLEQLVTLRYLPRDWEDGFAERLSASTVADLSEDREYPQNAAEISGLAAIRDLYLLERAGSLAQIPKDRLALYQNLPPSQATGPAARLLETLRKHANGAPDDHFSIDLVTGTLTAI